MLVRLSLPGPGTYKAEEGLDHTSRHLIAPAFSLAAPWQPPRPTSARPGPGAYRSTSCLLWTYGILRLDVVALVLVIMFKSEVVTSRLAIQCAPRRHANLRR
jgi:hypothetical protein